MTYKTLTPRVTVGVCVRNCANTVGAAIDGIIAQDYPHELMEVLIVDGYSRDGTPLIIDKHIKESDIEVRVFYEDKGLGYARQLVVDNASGKYIVWVDGDMVIPKDFIRKQVEFMEKNPEVAIAKGIYKISPNQNNLVAFLENVEFALSFAYVKEEKLNSVGASGCIYRVKAIKNIGGFDIKIAGGGEDSDIESRLRAAGWKIFISPASFYEMRRETWRELWKEYFWLGQGGFYVFKKNRENFPETSHISILLNKLLQSVHAYTLFRRKEVFLLPLHYCFKRIAWLCGYVYAYLKNGQFDVSDK